MNSSRTLAWLVSVAYVRFDLVLYFIAKTGLAGQGFARPVQFNVPHMYNL